MHLLSLVDLSKAVEYVRACANFDGGYGISPGAESHSGQIYVCLGALAIAGRLDLVDKDRLGGWLSERQLDSGGLNGRPEKVEDVCYSWWVVSSLAMIGKLHWIDGKKLSQYILRCQVSCSVHHKRRYSSSPGCGHGWHCRSAWGCSRCLSHRVRSCWSKLNWVSGTGAD